MRFCELAKENNPEGGYRFDKVNAYRESNSRNLLKKEDLVGEEISDEECNMLVTDLRFCSVSKEERY